MNIFTRVICLVLLGSALVFFFFHTVIQSQTSTAQRFVTEEAERVTGDKFRYAKISPKGTKIFSVTKPSDNMISAIDRGLDRMFAIAKSRKYQFSKRLHHSDYSIYIARADRTRNGGGDYSPDIAIQAKQYAGSVYDKGGYVYAAGMVVAFNPCAFVIAEHQKNFERVSEVVGYEGEHLVLYHNNRRLFNQTADHSKGGGHPILK